MYRVDRNNFYTNEKKSTIYTPDFVSLFLFDILHPHIDKKSYILDLCVGGGYLLKPWQKNKWGVRGIDIEDQNFAPTIIKNFLAVERKDLPNKKPSLAITNPPFNLDIKTKEYIKQNYGGRPLLPEIWLKKLFLYLAKIFPW